MWWVGRFGRIKQHDEAPKRLIILMEAATISRIARAKGFVVWRWGRGSFPALAETTKEVQPHQHVVSSRAAETPWLFRVILPQTHTSQPR